MFGVNLLILAQIYDQLLYGQIKIHGRMDRRTDGRTDTSNDNTPAALKVKG